MRRNARRLGLAALISAGCAGATVSWYQSTGHPVRDHGNRQPVARILRSENEVMRKAAHRLIWEEISQNEDLYLGEAIRTSGSSEATIQFLETGLEIDLEAGSIIELEQSAQGLALNFLDGNMFVRANPDGAGTAASAVTVKSGENTLALSGASVNLGRTGTGELDLQVLSGSVAATTTDGRTVTVESGEAGVLSAGKVEVHPEIRILSPSLNETVYIDPARGELFDVRWEPLPGEWEYFLKAGSDRANLIRVAKQSVQSGRLQAHLPVGRPFWQLVARSKEAGPSEVASRVHRTQVLAKAPPLLIDPDNQSLIALNQAAPNHVFKWLNPAQLQQQKIEIWRIENRQHVENSRIVHDAGESNQFTVSFTQPGLYQARVTGYLYREGQPITVSSVVRTFRVKIGLDIVPPEIVSPKPDSRHSLGEVQSAGLKFEWQSVPGMIGYLVEIQRDDGKTKAIRREAAGTSLAIKNLSPGRYTWHVTSQGPEEGQTSKPSVAHSFTVNDLASLAWLDGNDESVAYYEGDKPQIKLQWDRGPEGTQSWRARFVTENGNMPEAGWVRTAQPILQEPVGSEGRYWVEVEALDGNGQPLARSTRKTVSVQPRPLLPAPEFAAGTPKELKAGGNGRLDLAFDPVADAKDYRARILDSKNESPVKEVTFMRSPAALLDLPPGEYTIQLQARDKWDRMGPPGESRKLIVPEKSDVRAPAFKKIKVQ